MVNGEMVTVSKEAMSHFEYFLIYEKDEGG